ncbi:MAG: TRIC cation channel family protein [Sphaerochaetaceae bacterium]|nr:TRIC cation channel family protein [Sphaerochaetaceae bacterium]
MNFDLMLVLDIIGVVSFTVSGALVAANKKMDYFGVCILGVITSVGGGATRDIIIGKNPPVMFTNPIFVSIAFIISTIVFCLLFFKVKAKNSVNHLIEEILFWFDTIGLAAFTVDGAMVGLTMNAEASLFLCVFLGVITGVGGGVLRDLLASEVPAIFVKHIYAIASIVGAIAICLLWPLVSELVAVSISLVLVVAIRFLARRYRWNLPRIK